MASKEFYLQAAEECAAGNVDAGLWAKASSEALGDDSKAKAIYLRLRADELSDLSKVGMITAHKRMAIALLVAVLLVPLIMGAMQYRASQEVANREAARLAEPADQDD